LDSLLIRAIPVYSHGTGTLQALKRDSVTMMHRRPGYAGASDRPDRAGKIARLFERFGHLGMRFFGERRGNVVIVFGVALTVIVGAVGLGTDAASWYATKRAMQNAADLAAEGAINALKGYYPCTAPCTANTGYAKKEGKSAAALHGYVDGTGGTAVNLQVKGVDAALYSSANYTGAVNYGAVEAVVTQPAPLHFASLFMTSSPTIVARAVARLNTSATDCMYMRNPHAAKSFYFQGNALVNNPLCGAQVASDSGSAVSVTGGAASVTLASLEVAGGVSGSSSVFNSTPVTTGVQNMSDPYASRTLPTLASNYPNGNSWPGNKLQTVTPAATYSGDVTTTSTTASLFGGANCDSGCAISGNINLSGSTLTLTHGVYFVTGSISLGSNSSISTNGATIVLTNPSASASSIGTINMQSNPTVTMLAPSSTVGDPGYAVTQNFPGLAGIAMMQDPRASEATLNGNGTNICGVNCNSFVGGTSSSVNGAFYFPMGNIHWQGNGLTTDCFQLIADSLAMEGNPGIKVSGCTQGEALFGPTTAAMVE
jgi:hypothetical protein